MNAPKFEWARNCPRCQNPDCKYWVEFQLMYEQARRTFAPAESANMSICRHGVDHDIKWYADKELGVTGFRQDWCQQCLLEMMPGKCTCQPNQPLCPLCESKRYECTPD